jgi:hypothetical protein
MSEGSAARAALTLIALCGLGWWSCSESDKCREYSSFTCKQIETADYNVYFYFNKKNEDESDKRPPTYLGQVKGLS